MAFNYRIKSDNRTRAFQQLFQQHQRLGVEKLTVLGKKKKGEKRRKKGGKKEEKRGKRGERRGKEGKEEERKKKGGKERERRKRKAARVGRPGISTDRLIPSLKKALDGLPIASALCLRLCCPDLSRPQMIF